MIENYSTYEVNLGNWKLVSDGKSFSFPVDTIIDPETLLTLSPEQIDLPEGKEFILVNPQGEEFARFESMEGDLGTLTPLPAVESTADARSIILSTLRDAEEQLIVINTALARMSKEESEQSNKSVVLEQISNVGAKVAVAEETGESTAGETALLFETVTIEEDEGMFMKIVSLPLRAARYVTILFGGNR